MENIKYLTYVMLLILLSTSWSACTKDWLETDLIGAKPVDEFYLNEDEMGMALVAAYDMLHSDHLNGWSSPFMIKLLPSDDSNCGGGGASDINNYQSIDDYNWESRNPLIGALYQNAYYGIYRANKVISHKLAATPALNLMVAEAKCLRAYYYLDLMICFGPVPIQPEEDVPLSTPLPRATPAQMFAQIEGDLNAAIALLPNKTAYSSEDRYKMSKQAALGLLIKSNMFEKDYAGAIAAFEALQVDEGTEVGLYTGDYADLFKNPGEFSNESLIEACFRSTNRGWNGWGVGWSHDGNDHDNRNLQLWNPRGGDFGTSGMRNGWGFMPPTNKIEAAFEDGDLRKVATVLTWDDFETLYSADMTAGKGGHDDENCIRIKYAGFSSETIDPSTGAAETEYSTNWRLLRYADILLYAAEAYQRTGDNANARIQLNKVRSRAGLAPYTGNDLLAAIKHERFVELAFEGQRYWDLVRWGDAATEIPQFIENKLEVFPIPEISILNNAGLGPDAQNPGY